jgi:hypothetical protein
MPMVTLTKQFDVSNLIRISKRSSIKFNALLCWCIAKAASDMKVFYTLPERKKSMENKNPIEAAIMADEKASEAEVACAGDGEIVAAIIAAITAARTEEGASAPAGFRVVSFRKRK